MNSKLATMRCDNGHELVIKRGDPYPHIGNGFICNRCKRHITSLDMMQKGISRCAECQYDVCRDCFVVHESNTNSFQMVEAKIGNTMQLQSEQITAQD